MNVSAQRRRFIERELRDAIAAHYLMIFYQPQVTLDGREPAGLEAVARWRHPVKGWISPGEFVPVAEQSSLISELDNWILQAVFEQIERWYQAGCEPLPVAVNVAAQQFASKTFTELAGSLMKRYPAAVRRSRWNSPSGCFSAIMPTSHRDLLNPTPGRL
jgi:EAL domain-containing protein (putative c-di-GMP-specific phosphodiesterase class I)